MSLDKVDEKLADYSADHFLNGALVTNADNIIVYANTYFQKELQWNCNELIGKSVDKIITKSSKSVSRNAVNYAQRPRRAYGRYR